MAVDARHIYWANVAALAPDGSQITTIGRANLDGTRVDQTFITITGPFSATGVAVDHTASG